jgi:hypothetical protein
MTHHDEHEPGLVPIDDTDFKVADGDPDPRGWDVISADGKEIGEIDDLIVDTAAHKVRYLVCELDEDKLGLDDDRDLHILIPAGRARLSPDDKKLMLDGVTSSQIVSMPRYTGSLDSQYDDAAFGEPAPGGMAEPIDRREVRVTRPDGLR